MLKKYAHAFSLLQIRLFSGAVRYGLPDEVSSSDPVSDETRKEIENSLLAPVEEACRELNLRSPCEKVRRLRIDADWTYSSIGQGLTELRQRIEDELKYVEFLYVPPESARYYEQQALFDERVSKAFPSAVDDVQEAGTCFALGRWTATVHHCIGIMQVGLIALARHLKQPINIHIDDWESIIRAVEQGRDAKRAKLSKSRWKMVEPFYAEVISDLRAVKTAWRNPGAHFRRPFNESQALKALEKVRDFMQNLATRVGERK